jgi:hypothetical protein
MAVQSELVAPRRPLPWCDSLAPSPAKLARIGLFGGEISSADAKPRFKALSTPVESLRRPGPVTLRRAGHLWLRIGTEASPPVARKSSCS